MEQISLFSLLQESNTQLPDQKKTQKTFLQSPNFFFYRELYITLNRKPYQRSIRFYVKKGKTVQVNCSLHTSFKEITAVLEDHWEWIQKQLLEQKKLRRKYPLKKFRSSESFLFQGRKLKLKYENVFQKGTSFKKPAKKQKSFYLENDNLIYRWSRSEDLRREFLKRELRAFYEKEGKKKLQESLSLFSSRMQLVPRSIRIGSQKSLWGSCSDGGTVSLNWRLIVAPSSVLNYVVIHELAHLRHLNHSPPFWSLVSRFCPECKKCEHWLRHNAYAMDFLLPHSELHGFE